MPKFFFCKTALSLSSLRNRNNNVSGIFSPQLKNPGAFLPRPPKKIIKPFTFRENRIYFFFFSRTFKIPFSNYHEYGNFACFFYSKLVSYAITKIISKKITKEIQTPNPRLQQYYFEVTPSKLDTKFVMPK